MTTIFVKVTKAPGGVQEVSINQGSKVSDALAAANLSDVSGYTVTVNNEEVSLSTTLRDGDRVILSQSCKSA